MINERGATPAPDPEPAARTAKLREAVQARDTLADALTRAGIQLPAMDVRTPWRDAVEESPTARYALVHLGVCSAPVAYALAAAIARGIGR